MSSSYAEPLHVVLVEDDDVDAEAVVRLLRKARLRFDLTVFPDGRAAQDALGGPFGSRLQADRHLFLLDLNMPRLNGLEFLAWLRNEPAFHTAVVFVFTTSDTENDRQRAYQFHPAGYLPKARLGTGYEELLPLLTAYSEAVAFPPAGTPRINLRGESLA